MRRIFMIIFLLINYAYSQDAKSICIRINELNKEILNGTIKRAAATREFKQLLALLRGDKPMLMQHKWIFPLHGYNYHAIGGTGGIGYSDRGYNFLDGNKHAAHPAHDIFIRDENQDCLDDRTGRPVNVLAVDDGVVIACTDSWNPESDLRGGKFIWIYHHQLDCITYYAHNSSIFVNLGDLIKQGQKIAEVGRTGFNAYKKRSPTHLHFSAFHITDGLPVPYNPYNQLTKAEDR